jgi:TRAP-type C4-dicarboxylate transport system permease small subunit
MVGRVYRRLLQALAATAALLLGAMAIAVCADVVLRNLGLGAAPWILELSEYILPLATFLTAPWLLLRGEHIRLDIVLHALPPRAARGMEVAVSALGAAICGVLLVYGVRTALDSAAHGAKVFKSVVFPEWWLYAPFAACFALLAIEFLRRMLVRGNADADPRA